MPHRYPHEAVLTDDRRVQLRLFTEEDVPELHALFVRLPEQVRRFAWDRIEDRRVVEDWGRHIDYAKALPLVASDGQRIVGDATLHRRRGGPLRLVGRIKWLIDPDYAASGLSTLLVSRLVDTAREQGLRHVTCMLMSDLEAETIAELRRRGFDAYVVPGYGTDPDGGQHDMTKLVLKLL